MSFQALISQICQPNPGVIKDNIKRETTFYRNQSVLYIEIIFLLSLLIYAALGNILNHTVFQIVLIANSSRLLIFLITCRSFPVFFQILYFICMTMIGPCLLYFNRHLIYFNLISVYFIPMCILYLNGRKAFILQSIIQVFLLHMYYKSNLAIFLETVDFHEHARLLIKLTITGVIINSIFTLINQMSLVKAYHQIMTEKNKKAELERQKTFHLSFSHELRNLINTMLGSIQLSILEHLPSKVREFLHNSEVCGELLLHLINNILDTGKVEIGELEINATPNAVYDTFEKVWSVCSQLIKTKQLIGQMRIQKNLPKTLKLDNYRLMQIMMNIIGNAIKFTESGSINIDVQWIEDMEAVNDQCFEPQPFDNDDEGLFEKGQALTLLNKNLIFLDLEHKKIKGDRVSRRTQASKGILKIIVTDTGCGISSHKLPMLFNKFSQVNDDPSKRKLGTGLGLFITKELIERMQGKIRAFSKEGQGTAFIACLPAEVTESTEVRPIGKNTFINLAKSKSVRAMIVDDDDFNIDILSNYLTKLGIQVVDVAKNGLEAVEKFQAHARAKNNLDVITMDIEMPIMDGKRATQLIRSFEGDHNLPPCLLITVSANCTESEIAACVEEFKSPRPTKADFFMKKPASISDLLKALKTRFEDGTWSQKVNEMS